MSRSNVHRAVSSVAFVIAIGLVALPGTAAADEVNPELAEARAASAAFHNPEAAIAAGYLPSPECVSAPGLGTMGFHYVKVDLFDIALDVTTPEALLYAYDADGALPLVGIEFLAVALANTPGGPAPWLDATAPPGGFFNPSPTLFGHTFDGPMAGHGPGMPWHCDLHVWMWARNPSGTFAPFNPSPNVTCAAA